MEASKCPKCGEEPHFVEQLEKWYCYGCNSYVEDEEQQAHENHEKAQPQASMANEIADELNALDAEDQQVCKKCGAVLEKTRDGSVFCSICECPSEGLPAGLVPGAEEESKLNEAQALIDSIMVATPMEPVAGPASVQTSGSGDEPLPEIRMCSVCGQPLKYIEKYERHYCYGCRKYAPREGLDKHPAPAKPSSLATKKCPDCGRELRYIDKYSEYYCNACKKYPLRAAKGSGDLKCPKCGERLRYIEKYSRHYCIACKEYAPKGYRERSGESKSCPVCQQQMRYVSEYNEWYCFKCKKYSLRPNKPVLLI